MKGMGAAASGVYRTATKAAIYPGDSFTADGLMPGWVTTAADKANMLIYCGFYPDPGFIDMWTSGASMTYDGVSYYWTGTIWRPLSTAIGYIYGTPDLTYVSHCDYNRIPIAKRSATVAKQYYANPQTAWGADEYMAISTSNAGGDGGPAHIIQWNGTQWVFLSTAPEYTGNPWDKTVTPGCQTAMNTSITAQDATNAAKLAGLGYTMTPNLGAPGSLSYYGAVTFPSPTTAGTYYVFSWNGTAWQHFVSNYSAATYNNITHAGIAALPVVNRPWAATTYLFPTYTYSKYTPSTYITVGGTQMYNVGNNSRWAHGPAPGTVPPVPSNKAAVMPGDIYTNYQSFTPTPINNGFSLINCMGPWLTAGGVKPHTSEILPWRSATKKVLNYVNCEVAWTGTHWWYQLGTTKVTLTPTSAPVPYRQDEAPPALGSAAEADRLNIMNSYYTANPLTAWGASESVWVGNCIVRWNGTAWVDVAKPVRIHETATYVCTPGDHFIDSRVTAENSTIAGQLLGWGYVPLYRGAWSNRTEFPQAGYVQITFWESTTATSTSTYRYYWNGTTWVAGFNPSTNGTVVAPSAGVANATISALPAEEQVTACTLYGYYSSTGAQWTSGQSATIAGNIVHWHGATTRRYWAPGAAP